MPYLINAVVPGAGLIVSGREWLGLTLCVLFGVCGHVAVAAWLTAPEAFPAWLVWIVTALLSSVWIAAQLLLRSCRAANCSKIPAEC